MPKIISGSPNIAVLDSRIISDLCIGKFYIDVSSSSYIGSGAAQVLGARVKIENPYGVVVKNYSSSYEIAPSMTAGMNTVVQFNIPTQSLAYQWGKYIISVKLTDSDNKEYTLIKDLDLKCAPSFKNKKYGTIGASLKGNCKGGKVAVLVDTPPIYNGVVFESQSSSFNLSYPTESELATINTPASNFSVPLIEGLYKVSGDTCVTYNLGDNIYVKLKYALSTSKEILCGLDQCIILPRLISLNQKLDSNCSEEERVSTTNIILEALNLLKLIELGIECGEDISEYSIALVKLLGISRVEIRKTITNNTPSTDFLIEGCGYEKQTIGLTDKYIINNYDYITTVEENGGAVVISESVLSGCTKTQEITFNINSVYNQIKNIVLKSNTETLFWTQIINKGLLLGDIDWACLGLTPAQVSTFTLAQKFSHLITFVCACCACDAKIISHSVAASGDDALIAWVQEDASSIEIYVDDVQVAVVLGGVTQYTVKNVADGEGHSYQLIPRGSNGKSCSSELGTFNFNGCAAINPPSVSTNNANGVNCPYDLTLLVSSLPVGITPEWHTANNTNPNSLVGNPASVSSGTYWVFAKDGEGCYSTGVMVTVLCEAASSCTAPQNLTVKDVPTGFLIQFQSATNPPPYNSYLVKRKLTADEDTPSLSNYDTIGTPVWNASTNRWEIVDTTGADNTLYTYMAMSLCADDKKPAIFFNFTNITCPKEVTLTKTSDTISYSFDGVGGAVDKYEVVLFQSSPAPVSQFNTIIPAFSNPISGNFTGLNAGTYYVKVKVYIGSIVKVCPATEIRIDETNICPEIVSITGVGSFG